MSSPERITPALLCAAIFTILVGCGHSWIPRNPLSEQKQAERCTITFEPYPEAEVLVAAAPLIAEAAGRGLDLTIKYIQKELDKEAKRYTAKYAAYGADDEFYYSDPNVKINEIIFTRQVIPERRTDILALKTKNMPEEFKTFKASLKGKHEDEPVEAMKLNLNIISSDDGFYFRLVPNYLRINLTKAKLRGGWPIFGGEDDDLDIDILVTFSVWWTDKEQTSHREDYKLPPIQLRSIKLHEKVDVNNAALQEVSSYWIPMIKRSENKDAKKEGKGTYAVKIEVVEFDDFGERVASVAEYVEEHREDWTKTLVELLEKKLDESKEE